jgi:hypothetical protein
VPCTGPCGKVLKGEMGSGKLQLAASRSRAGDVDGRYEPISTNLSRHLRR